MNPDTGEIRSMVDWAKGLTQEKEEVVLENLVPFDVSEIVEVKGCRFKVRSIFPHPQNIVTLQGIPKIPTESKQ